MVCLSYRFVPIFFSVLSVGCSVFNEESSRERGREMGGQAELAGYPSIREDYGARAAPESGWGTNVPAHVDVSEKPPVVQPSSR